MQLTRREFGACLGAGLGMMAAGAADAAAPAPATAVFKNACDCHVHIIGPQAKYPMVAGRPYTPPEATVAQLRALHRRLGVARTVLVQPSFYGTDNACMLDALKELGAAARAVAVVAPNVADAELKAMDAKGVRGVRLNLESAGKRNPKAAAALLKAFDKKLAPLDWHIQIYTVLPVIDALGDAIADMKVPVVVDHFGMPDMSSGGYPKGFSALVDLARARKIYVKLSAPYRFSKAKNYSDTTALAQTLIYAARDHMLWGSDWPHTQQIAGHSATEVTPFNKIDDSAIMRLFNSWYPDETTRRMILVDNPAKLYRFG
jgi:predicted TIM-barrel fold metal-dependent hydrolase